MDCDATNKVFGLKSKGTPGQETPAYRRSERRPMADQAGRGGGGGIGRNPVGILRQRAAPLEAGWVLAAMVFGELRGAV